MEHKVEMKDNPQSRKPVDNDFQQQRLRAWQPLLTPKYVIGTFAIIGVLFIIIGAICLAASNSVVEVEVEYTGKNVVQFTPSADMKAPVYFYYKLTNFFQNHRRYVKSRSDTQLKGGTGTANCDPLTGNGAGKDLYPCGLIANSMFNDSFVMCTGNDPTCPPGSQITLKESGIAWKSDRDSKFKARAPTAEEVVPMGLKNVAFVNGSDPSRGFTEHFLVWMRTAGLPTFKKLWARIETDLKAGTQYTVKIAGGFNVASFSGTKSIVVSTVSWLGGKNTFLGGAYLAVGILCILLAIAFAIKDKISPRPLGDMKYFNWPGMARAPAAAR